MTIKVTPPSEARMTLAVYNNNRERVKQEMGSNLGAIISYSITSTKNEDIFVIVSCDKYCSESIANYDLSIVSEEASVDATILSNGETGSVDTTIGSGQETIKSFGETIVKMVFQGVKFLFFAIVFGIAIYFFLKKRKKDLRKKEEKEEEKDSEQPK